MKSWQSFSHSMISLVSLTVLTSIMLMLIMGKSSFYSIEITFFSYNQIPVSMILLVDQWSTLFFLTVSLISMSVLMFSTNYMASEPWYSRFHCLLGSFIFSMLLLIFSPGLFSLFLGWDGLGLSSFLLVIYYNNSKTLNAGLLTFFSNRLGDGFLLSGMACGLLMTNFNIFISQMGGAYGFWLILLLILGAMTKSAQIPFSAWLPAAMAAPTPVSSLVHSSTLVTAGVYVLFRLSDILPKKFLLFLFFVGLTTMTLASLSALTEMDMKKIVALSTLSQLGLMFIALGLSNFSLSFFHLITHAFFKALMFISVGEIMSKTAGHQGLKFMGISSVSPIVLGTLMGANFSLTGLPFFSGFFSKEAIMEFSSNFYSLSLLIYLLFLISVILTQLYSIRFIYKVTLLSQNFMSTQDFSLPQQNSTIGFMILILPACLTGSMLSSYMMLSLDFIITPMKMKIMTVSLVLLSLIISFKLLKSQLSYPYMWFFSNMWLLPLFSGMFFSKFFLNSDTPKKVFFSSVSENMFLMILKKISFLFMKVLNLSSYYTLQVMVLFLILMLMF